MIDRLINIHIYIDTDTDTDIDIDIDIVGRAKSLYIKTTRDAITTQLHRTSFFPPKVLKLHK